MNLQSLTQQSIISLTNLSSDPDSTLNFYRSDSLLSRILIPRPVESQNLSDCRQIFSRHFEGLSNSIDVPDSHPIYKNLKTQPSYSSQQIHQIKTWSLESHSFTDQTPYGTKRFTSQIFTHDPTAPLRLILAAHIDSKFFPNSPQNGFVGATDSAAPVAIILEVARSLTPLLDSQLIQHLNSYQEERVTLQVVLLDGEEAFKDWSSTDSIYGARALAKAWSEPQSTPTATSKLIRSLDEIQAFVLLDLLGSSEPTINNYYQETGWIFDTMERAESRLDELGIFKDLRIKTLKAEGSKPVKLQRDRGRRRPFFVKRNHHNQVSFGHIEDDHLPFLKEDVPILHLISSPFPRVWHSLEDDRTALDLQTILEWNLILQTSLIEYFGLHRFLKNSYSKDLNVRRKDELVI
ncbi:glutaminyl-peptide cyclotransferase [Phakopsora pachyrhizi]|uniref:Peptide hydrolase n=1 Tax=Phakopsora pachyrhizi TaxID=170000 RepID=A0AAV0BA51_PHAPC|nr:glutaminyl-peptide cyclotransferase [Phakopsora pachyrhizi]CAH7683449.1 glutaminyl-peptide cyclotransferase [Phakopsora pachyrhizi]